ncbi:MAG TPA: Gfo/Idh/MocA family oxidoreductase [Fimbriimonadaceae bacterium]|nr:Gfo/Idh/MocA family oxidoreductase [Fimbriimonadaceae bacterium]
MPLRIGFLSVAHLHAGGYAHAIRSNPHAEIGGVWDPDEAGRGRFAKQWEAQEFLDREALLDSVDAVVITSENKLHAELGEAAARRGKHILCEKPLVTSEEEGARLLSAVDEAGVKLMTAFPCRYSPAFKRALDRVRSGDIGAVQAVCSTNRGRCPFGWFVDVEKSGGGAMIDHTVHVADLLRVLLGDEVTRVQAQTGNNMYGEAWDDTAMLTLEFAKGVFATLDSSWSRHKTYKTWGDVTMNIVGEEGVIEIDMFGQALDVHRPGDLTHTVAYYGSGLDEGLVGDFVDCILEDKAPPITGFDGLQAARVAMAGYQSVASGTVVAVPS